MLLRGVKAGPTNSYLTELLFLSSPQDIHTCELPINLVRFMQKKLPNISAYVNIANHNAIDPKQQRIINNVSALKYGMFVLDVVQDKSC